jgi:hypothetical protein
MKKLIVLFVVNIAFLKATDPIDFFNFNNQRGREYVMRLAAALQSTLEQPNYTITAENNGEATAANLFGTAHTKSLTHDTVTGLLTPGGVLNYEQLLKAIASTEQADFNAVVRFPGSSKFANPQAGNMLSLEGVPNNLIPLPIFPRFSSAEGAALIIELYLQAICRGVLFSDYGEGEGTTDEDTINGGSITNNAATILTALGAAYTGPKAAGVVTANLLFKMDGFESLVGPYISQFSFFDVPIPELTNFTPRTFSPVVGVAQTREFGVSFADFVGLQNGTTPRPYVAGDFVGTRYIVEGRDLATLVHKDNPGEIYFYTANILLANGFPFSPVLPYYNASITNEGAFVGLAVTDIYGALFGATFECLKHAWAHKWRGDRIARPDAFAGLVHNAKVTNTNPYNLNASIFATYEVPDTTFGTINLLDWVKAYNSMQGDPMEIVPPLPIIPAADAETYLLSQMYPEGSPVHPSYPAGHAVYSGACITILKAFFKDDVKIIDHKLPVIPNEANPTVLIQLTDGTESLLTVSGELNKLAITIAMGRNFAGIHYRMDGFEGIFLGEQVALDYLRDRARLYNEQTFTGFELTKFNGDRVRVTADAIINIG